MSKVDGIKRRLGAAAKAIKGDYVIVDDNPQAYVPKGSVPVVDPKTGKTVNLASSNKVVKDDTTPTIEILKPEYCTGCGACVNVCPKNAISMQKDKEGFLAPVVDHKKCISCGLCQKICPAINWEKGSKNNSDPECKAIWAEDDIRMKSSSGGMFTVLAEYVLKNGGYVCGAAYEKENKFYVKHKIISKPEDLDELRGSKYVQSDINFVMRDIKKLLNDSKTVLFCGTPCQTAGLKRFLNKDYDNLIICDLVCHGVPSYESFGKYLEDNYNLEDIKDFRFRHKEDGYNCTSAVVEFKDDTKKIVNIKDDPYEKMFHSAIAYRNCCYDCKYAALPRYGDFTIGDFWGISKFNKAFNDRKGTTLLLINNKKAQDIFDKIKDKLILNEDAPIDIAMKYNSFSSERERPEARDRFYKFLKETGYTFGKALRYSREKRFDIGVIGLWYGRNYGSMATYFALHQVLKNKFNMSVLMIDNPLAGDEPPNTHPRRIARAFYDISENYSLGELRYLNETCDKFIVGSDQLWNVYLSRPYGQMYYLDFVNSLRKKISYGTSFAGEYKGTEDERRISSANLKKFDHVSVRDRISKEICEKQFGVKNVTEVYDPTLIVSVEEYQRLIDKASVKEEEEYILAYILDPNEDIGRELEQLSRDKNKKVIVLLDEVPWEWEKNNKKLNLSGNANVEVKKNVSLYNWMWYYQNASSVVTDSFHGTIFSIIFQKPFITMRNNKRGGLRFGALLEPIDLQYRLFEGSQSIGEHKDLLDSIDYTESNKKREKLKERSLKWLENALFNSDPYDVAVEKAKKAEAEAKKNAVIINDSVTVEALNEKYCTGCGACRNLCPVDAISMEYNSEGFLAPVIDHEKCINCGLCLKKCPSAHPDYNNDTPKCYAAFGSDEIRKQSSSGGIFSLIADKILAQGGYVCGAAFDDKFVLKHMVVNDEEGMKKLRESKYVQSDTNTVYRQIGELLKDNKPVLFVGCGCQVAGLKAYLSGKNIESKNLFSVDLMCHGSPSPKLFEQYINEYHGGPDNIEKLSFRTKEHFGWSTEMNVVYKDGTEYRQPRGIDPYYKAFLPCISVRKSCGVCPTAKIPRQGDITLADFWGVRALNGNYDDGKGTSIVITNNEAGEKMLNEIAPDLKLLEGVTNDYILTHGQPFNHTFKTNPAHNMFFKNLSLGMSVDKAYDYAVNRKFDVAVMGVWYGCNYGSVATYYALHSLLESFGLSVLMIDKPIIKPNDVELGNTHARRFALEHYEISKNYRLNELKALNKNADTFILGCDQVWNRGISRHFGLSYYFNFVESSKKMLTYATSFGHEVDFASPQDRAVLSEYMKRFDGISIREDDGVKICKDIYGVEAVQVLDPVFAADRQIFDELADSSEARNRPNKDEKYIASYLLDPTPEKVEALRWLSQKLGYKVICLLDGFPHVFKTNSEKMEGIGEIPQNVEIQDWLYYIKNSEFLVTDSCHGMSFGIIFGKTFIGIGNKARGLSRFNSLMRVFDLKERLVTDAKDIVGNEEFLKPIDYEKVGKILASEQARSRQWLKDNLFKPKKVKDYRVYRVIDENADNKN